MAEQNVPSTTIPPFSDIQVFPTCAIGCGPLYDANGACVPPAVPNVGAEAYTSCFCLHATLAPFSTGSTGVCDTACPGSGLNSIATWYRSICSVNDGSNNGGGSGDSGDSGDTGDSGDSNNGGSGNTGNSGGSSGDTSNSSGGGGGDWLSNHWQWVIFLVVLVVAIVGIWVGACIWRRRYLKKKEQLKFNQKNASTPEGGVISASTSGKTDGAPPPPGSFMPDSHSGSYGEKGKSRVMRWAGRDA